MSTATEATEATAPTADEPVRRPRTGAGLWVIPPLLVILLLVGWPMATVLGASLDGSKASSWGGVLTSAEFLGALLRTVQIAVGATVGAVVVGGFLAVVIAFVPFPGARLVARVIDTLLALPSFLITLAFTLLYGSAGVAASVLMQVSGGAVRLPAILTSPLGVILAEATYFTPFVVRPLLAAFAGIPREQLDVAASLGAGPLRVIRTVLLPDALPAFAAGGSLVLLLALNEFGIVLFTGAKDVITLPVLIYVRGVVSLDLPGAAVVAVAQVVLSLLLYTGYRVAFARRTGTESPLEPEGESRRAAVVAPR